jgi:hypothetical protein
LAFTLHILHDLYETLKHKSDTTLACYKKIYVTKKYFRHNIILDGQEKEEKKNLIQRAMFALMNKKYGTISIIQFSMCYNL